jgi:Biotin-requiring enzyme
MQCAAYIVTAPPLAGGHVVSQFSGRTSVIRPARWSVLSLRRATSTHPPGTVRRPGKHAFVMQFVDQQRLLDIRAKEVFMPALSSTMTEGVIVAWLKKPGDKVDVGEMLMTVESDKADMDGTKTKNMLLLHLTFSFFVLLFSHC